MRKAVNRSAGERVINVCRPDRGTPVTLKFYDVDVARGRGPPSSKTQNGHRWFSGHSCALSEYRIQHAQGAGNENSDYRFNIYRRRAIRFGRRGNAFYIRSAIRTCGFRECRPRGLCMRSRISRESVGPLPPERRSRSAPRLCRREIWMASPATATSMGLSSPPPLPRRPLVDKSRFRGVLSASLLTTVNPGVTECRAR